ncbi:MAG: bacterial transcriptional activator domain-containing protein, partial [Fimbriimonadaceae bacterium]|nr:bacterial transcriptional activator domain-containing protein [Fimbriimonadaceae bacterium]
MEIRLLGPGAPDRLSALPTILAVEHPVRLSREQLILRLWPGADSESARNRLRVGLSRLRSEGLLDETPAGVRLDPARVRVDLVEALAALTLAASEPDVNTERRMLVELLPTLELSVLPDLEADWVLDRRSEWSLAAADAVSRLLDLCAETRDSEAAVRAAEAGLAHFPQDPAFWRARLVALGRLGRSAEAARLFQDARRRMRREGADFDPDLLDLAPSMAAGGDWDPQPEFTRGEAGLLLRTLQRMLEAEPDEAAALLAGRAFRREM